jgi:hypothetical protein
LCMRGYGSGKKANPTDRWLRNFKLEEEKMPCILLLPADSAEAPVQDSAHGLSCRPVEANSTRPTYMGVCCFAEYHPPLFKAAKNEGTPSIGPVHTTDIRPQIGTLPLYRFLQ